MNNYYLDDFKYEISIFFKCEHNFDLLMNIKEKCVFFKFCLYIKTRTVSFHAV